MKTTLLLAFLTCPTFAANLPDEVIPSGVGVNIHFVRGNERNLDLIAAAGFKFIRMDFGWSAIERKRGEYDWSEYEELTTNLEKRGLRALYILDYSNELYEETVESKNPINGHVQRDTASPQHPESIAAYARWAAAAAVHFKGRGVIWEMWNEPNITFWKPRPDAKQYAALALAAAKTIRAAEPSATIIGPGTSGFGWEFMETFLSSGVLDYIDAVSVHPYRSPKQFPETAAADFDRLRGMIEKHGHKLPIISSEWGYSSNTKGVSLETQAAFIVRQQLSNLLNHVPLSIWYDWQNDGEDPAENEHNFGTVTWEIQPKPAYIALQTMTRELKGFRIERRVQVDEPRDFVVLLKNGSGARKLAAWTTSNAHEAIVSVSTEKPAVVLGDGKPGPVEIDNGKLRLKLTAAPQFVSGLKM